MLWEKGRCGGSLFPYFQQGALSLLFLLFVCPYNIKVKNPAPDNNYHILEFQSINYFLLKYSWFTILG